MFAESGGVLNRRQGTVGSPLILTSFKNIGHGAYIIAPEKAVSVTVTIIDKLCLIDRLEIYSGSPVDRSGPLVKRYSLLITVFFLYFSQDILFLASMLEQNKHVLRFIFKTVCGTVLFTNQR